MDILAKVLDIFFRRIPPERILNRITNNIQELSNSFKDTDIKDLFMRFAEASLHGYSNDEINNIFMLIKENVHLFYTKAYYFQTDYIFSSILAAVNRVLITVDDEPRFKINETIKWRELYLFLGQDVATCAYLAFIDMKSGYTRNIFLWPAILESDDVFLQQLIRKGIAENHRHLNGSTYSFDLIWYFFMNNPLDYKQLPGEHLMMSMSRGADDNILSNEQRLILAAHIRTILFRMLHKNEFSNGEDYNKGSKGTHGFEALSSFIKEYKKSFIPTANLLRLIRELQKTYGMEVLLPSGERQCLDYALERTLAEDSHHYNSFYRIMIGERNLLYQCFSLSFQGRLLPCEQMIFYLYLILKTVFRAEFIQQNSQVGFNNFAQYEQRKSIYAAAKAYVWEAYRMSLNAPLSTQAIVSLESRITPENDVNGIIKKVRKIDLAKCFADIISPTPFWWISNPFRPDEEPNKYKQEPYFFVFHFIKESEPLQSDCNSFQLECRHDKLRSKVKKQAIAIIAALEKSKYLCNRIRGIDACNCEINCRPEVFSTAFRFIKGYRSKDMNVNSFQNAGHSRHISLTYHVGEDFYDIADGLRAIDETIQFLGFDRGDRIGHGLALGVDPLTHYSLKSDTIILPKQNYLDNLVWLVYRGRELDFEIDPGLYGILKQNAYQLMMEIYGDAINKNNWSVSLDEYYYSMMLRGDNPLLYVNMRYEPINSFAADQYDCFSAQLSYNYLDTYRNDKRIAGLYYYYQYGYFEKKEGQRIVKKSITRKYMELMKCAQFALQKNIEKRGIIIECNPSSNVLIGTFGDYTHHPIFMFNNPDNSINKIEKDAFRPRLHTCINTDDLGIFDTSLEFEYALMYRAMLTATDSEGNHLYTSYDALNYLETIRKMGLSASFPVPGN